MTGLCRDCLETAPTAAVDRCPACGAPRWLDHPELDTLSIAHLDCDAFYASIEKRDDPALRGKPVIVGGSQRGVVAAACYVARLYGVRSAMPMFKALRACPDAVVIPPDMAKYRAVGRQIRAMMFELTPLVEPLSIDEAFLDLGGTDALHGGPPTRTLAALARRIERELRLTVSIGLSYNKFLAKIASDLDKPRGFAVIGRAEAKDFLADKPVGLIWGVGKSLQGALASDGIERIGQLRRFGETELVGRYGAIGRRLYRFCRGEDARSVDPDSPAKSISAETTFARDLTDPVDLERRLWPLCETVAGRLKRAGLAAASITLKLKTCDFKSLTRTRRLTDPTQLADRLFRTGQELLRAEADGRLFRLIGIGATELCGADRADPPDLLDPDRARRMRVESAMDVLRDRLGPDAIVKGRDLSSHRRRSKPSD